MVDVDFMVFEEWDDEYWKVKCRVDNGLFELKAPDTIYVFNKHDFLELSKNINAVVDNLFEKDVYYIYDGGIFNRETGEHLLGIIDGCVKLNEQDKKIKQLEELIASLQAQLFLEIVD